MREQGLDAAIRAAGGIGALARRIGISQPSVSNWARIPAERVLSVEEATGVDREILRPDLYGKQPAERGEIDDVDAARAQEYALLSVLLARAPDAALLARLAQLRGDASPLGLAHAALGEAARRADAERVEREFFDLFIGLGRGELLPYGSYYLTGFLHERPLARLRADLSGSGSSDRRPCRAGGSRRDPVRDHGGARRAAASGVPRAPTASCSSSISRPGSGASSPIWSGAEAADFYRR